MANSALSVSIDADIVTTAAFSTALANGVVFGNSEGHFFGADAASLAGIATFANRQLDTAFGGAKK